EPVDAAHAAAHCRTLVHPAKLLFPVAGATGDRARGLLCLALDRGRAGGAAISRDNRTISAGVPRPGNFQFSLSGPTAAYRVRRSGSAGEPDFHAARHGAAVANRAGLHRFHLLAVSRQSPRRRKLPLTRKISRETP